MPGTSRSGGGLLAAWASALVCGVAVVLAATRVLGLDVLTPLVPAIAYYPYLVGLTALLLVVPWRARRVRLAGLMAVALLVAVVPLAPRAIGDGDPSVDQVGSRTLVVAALNLFHSRAEPAEVVAIAAQSEVMALVEVTEQGLDRLAAAGLDDVMPYRVLDLHGRAGGTGIWSRHPLVEGDRLDTFHAMPSATVMVPGTADGVSVRAVHPVSPTRGHRGRWAQEMALLASEPPVDVMLGDFNATLDHRAFRQLLRTGFTDVADALGEGFVATWPAEGWPLPGIVIDHVLTGEGITPLALEVRDVAGSDHRAVMADIAVS